MGDLAGLCPALDPDGYVYICPNAPLPMNIGQGAVGFAWTAPGGDRGQEQADEAESLLDRLLEEVLRFYDLETPDVLLSGFSQGGMMTYRRGLTTDEPFAGLAALSARISDPGALQLRLNSHRDLPIFVTHGTQDAVIPVSAGRESMEFLRDEGYDPEYHEYPMGHEITQAVIDDLRTWLHRVLPPWPSEE